MRVLVLLISLVLLTACSDSLLPQVTPTVAPTVDVTITPASTEVSELPSATQLPTMTRTSTQTATATATLLPINTATDIPSNTPTITLSPTVTLSPTITPLPIVLETATNTPTKTSSPTLTPTSTLTPLPTATDTPVPPTATTRPSETPDLTATFINQFTSTPLPTVTSTPNLTGTAIALFTDTPIPVSNTPVITPTVVILPTNTTEITQPPPTIDATPTFVTLAPATTVPQEQIATTTPIEGDSQIETFLPTPTSTPQPTVDIFDIPPTVARITLPTLPAPNIETRAFALNNEGGNPFELGTGITNPTLFVRNPVDPEVYLATDSIGLLYTVNNGQAAGLTMSPFTGLETSLEDNNAIVVDAAWSPDGTSIAFVVDADTTENDGVWWYMPGQTAPLQLLVDCLPNIDCQTVVRNDIPYTYESRSIVWSPDSESILTQIYMYDYDQYGLIVLPRTMDENVRNVRPFTLKYDYGDWSRDGEQIVISGRSLGSGQVILGLINPDGTDENIILNGSSLGLWLQNGVQGPDGQLYALGRQGDMNGAMRIFNGAGSPVTEIIGQVKPIAVKWNPNRDRVYVLTEDNRKYTASIYGDIEEITAQVGDIQAVEWVSGRLPPIAEQPATISLTELPPDYLPAGVIEDTRFQAGQQLRVNTDVGFLNLRAQPTVTDNIISVLENGSYVAILAGPKFNEGYEWWQVQTASGLNGWLAAVIDDQVVLIP